jgi:TonB family protein
MNDKLTREERFGLMVTSAMHIVLLAIVLLMHQKPEENLREAFIEVALGEFRMGAAAQFSEEQNPDVATRINPQTQQQPESTTPTDAIDLPTRENLPDDVGLTTPEAGEQNPEANKPVAVQQDEPVRRDTENRDGATDGGSVRGTTGSATADEGTTSDPVRSAPYQLTWDGDIERAPLQQPMPNYVVEVEATITVRFEVRPNGSVGRIIPVQRMNPELEREVMTTLRAWRFSSLPDGVPNESQWGRITFRFVLK